MINIIFFFHSSRQNTEYDRYRILEYFLFSLFTETVISVQMCANVKFYFEGMI